MKKIKIISLIIAATTISTTFSACGGTFADKVEPGALEQVTSAPVKAKSYTADELHKMIVNAPDAYAIDAPEQYGNQGWYHAGIYLSLGDYLEYLKNEDFLNKYPGTTESYTNAKYVGAVIANEQIGDITKEYPDLFEGAALNENSYKEYITKHSYEFNHVDVYKERKGVDIKPVADGILKKFPYEMSVAAYKRQTKYLKEATAPYTQEFVFDDEIKTTELPKLRNIADAWVNAKYLGTDMPADYTTDDFKATFNIDEIRNYYSQRGMVVSSFYSMDAGQNNTYDGTTYVQADWTKTTVPLVVKYTLRTEGGEEVFVADLMIFTNYYDEASDSFSYKLDYVVNLNYLRDNISNFTDVFETEKEKSNGYEGGIRAIFLQDAPVKVGTQNYLG